MSIDAIPYPPIGRLLALYEIYKLTLPVKGSVVELGVGRGLSFISWISFAVGLEPLNLTRRIIGFDTWDGFPEVTTEDENDIVTAPVHGHRFSIEPLKQWLEKHKGELWSFQQNRQRVELVPGNICDTLPEYLKQNPQLIVSLLFIDCDLYKPTKAGLELLGPRMPKGAVVAFDELDFAKWPGETRAALEVLNLNETRLLNSGPEGQISYAVIGA